MKFCTVINCMDGRTQLPVISFLQKYFKVEYVDSITEPGPVSILADPGIYPDVMNSIRERIGISIDSHNSQGLAVVAHHDCAGNPVSKVKQIKQLRNSVTFLREHYPDSHIIGLWVDEKQAVEIICPSLAVNLNQLPMDR